MTRHVAIAAPDPLSTQAGVQTVAAGGNAVDAALAAMITATVSAPGIVAPLGGCFINIWPTDDDPCVIDGNVEMPGRGASPDRFGGGLIRCVTTYGGGLTTYAGPGSVAVPGMFSAMGLAHQRFGTARWADLFRTSIAAISDGIPLSTTSSKYFDLVAHTIFSWDPATKAHYTDEGRGLPVGHLLRDENLAETLRRIADNGADYAYTGPLGEHIAADMQARGGLLTAADLAAYQPTVRPALRTRLADWDLACNPPPSIGGPVLTALLRLAEAETGPVGPRATARAMKAVLDHRLHKVDVADDLEAAGRDLLRIIEQFGDLGLSSSPDTAHVSVTDTDGTTCAITASAGYGSGMTITGTGLLTNNALGEPELNRRGMHILPPGARLASNMAPTTGRRDDGARLAIGSPGADRITTALMQVLLHFCVEGRDLQSAITAPRLHVRHLDDGSVRVDHEADEALREDLGGQPLPTEEHEPLAMYFGGVGATLAEPSGLLAAAADPRRASATAVT